MKAKRRELNGQNISEYSILLAIVLIATISMSTYVKRGLQGKYLDVSGLPIQVAKDSLSKSFVLSAQSPAYVVYDQYDPAYTKSQSEIMMGKQENVKYDTMGRVTRTVVPAATTTRTVVTKSEGF